MCDAGFRAFCAERRASEALAFVEACRAVRDLEGAPDAQETLYAAVMARFVCPERSWAPSSAERVHLGAAASTQASNTELPSPVERLALAEQTVLADLCGLWHEYRLGHTPRPATPAASLPAPRPPPTARGLGGRRRA